MIFSLYFTSLYWSLCKRFHLWHKKTSAIHKEEQTLKYKWFLFYIIKPISIPAANAAPIIPATFGPMACTER